MKKKADVRLKNHTTFRTGGKAKYFFEVKSKDEIRRVARFAKKKKLPIFILGGGTDILMSDEDFKGVVIKYVGKSARYQIRETRYLITAEAGCEWDRLVKEAVKRNLQGIECLSGIPGTVGAAPIQNIGAYGQELKDAFVKLTAYDFNREKFVTFDKKDCRFAYRDSVFKDAKYWQKFLICDLTLKLSFGKRPKVEYESLKKYLPKNPTLQAVREAVIKVRSKILEDWKENPNAGSFFKNPVVDLKTKKRLKRAFPLVKIFPFEKKFKVSAGWLIEQAGWKGKSLGRAKVSDKHALILTNPKGLGKAADVLGLARAIQKDVSQKFGISLEPEVQLINFGRKVAILGYGIEGQDAEKYFKSQGTDIAILDKNFDRKYLDNLEKFDEIVRSPGVYRYLPEIVKAEKNGVETTSAIKIFFENCPAKIIGVTGTKGKGTTSTLIYEILKKAGKDVYLAGNIGKPYLELLPVIKTTSYVVLELSSFQLIDMAASPHIAVVLNITSDHLDWHKDQKEYLDAKKNIVRHQMTSDHAVLNGDYKAPKNFARITSAKVVYFSKKTLETKYKEKLLLRGEHNLENIAAAVSVAKILRVDNKTILGALKSFKGLEHRLELVREVNGITFYNDSFATGPQPTIAAIKSFSETETLILGGSDKGLDYQELRREIEKRKNVKNLILIGEIGEKIGGGIKGKEIINLGKTSMNRIIEVAKELTPKGGVVILSPAAASFDMFENYKDRGNQFKEAVKKL